MKYLLSLFAIVALSTACTTGQSKTAYQYEGMCSHPAVNEGAPFPIRDGSAYEGSSLVVSQEDGTALLLTSPQCVLHRSPGSNPNNP